MHRAPYPNTQSQTPNHRVLRAGRNHGGGCCYRRGFSLCNWWLSWLRRWSVQEMYTKALWQKQQSEGVDGCRQATGLERNMPPEVHGHLGIQDSSQARYLSHISGEGLIHWELTKRRCWHRSTVWSWEESVCSITGDWVLIVPLSSCSDHYL